MTEETAAARLADGEKHLEAGEWEAAEAEFRRAIEADARSAVAYSKLGVSLVHQRRLDDAGQAFSRAVAIDPKYAPAWSNLGNIHREAGQTEQALEAYQRAIAADPDYWIAHQNLGGLYRQMGRMSEAIASLRKATRLSARAALRPTGAGQGRRVGCLGGAALWLIALAAALAIVRAHG
jgi:superkiller protein 3